jgi:hypothetical protein
VVATEERDAVRVAKLQREEEQKCIKVEIASIDIITEEEIICIGALANDPKKFKQIQKLAVSVATYCYGSIDSDDIREVSQKLDAELAY